ncbi:AraC family transcriptional regulator [Pseudomonas sp. B392_1p]|uniref:AraC family transcriptional regulator n=1 Tax=Pseudomonas sp. B392_1p TaxID=3457507 RepID=UPI003FCF4AE4
MQKLDYLLKRMEARGIAVDSLLDGTGIAPSDVGNAGYMPSASQYRALLRRIIDLSPPGIGIRIGLEVKVLGEGLPGYAALCSATLRGMNEFSKTYKTLVNDFTRYSDTVENGEWHLKFSAVGGMEDVQTFLVEEMYARVKTAQQSYTGVDIPYKRLDLVYPEPHYAKMYRDIFRCPVRFNQKQNCLAVDAKYLDLPLAFSAAEISGLLEAQCVQLLGAASNCTSVGVAIKRHLILNPGHYPTLTEMSAIMSLSPASLKRKLKAEGETYQGILDSIRKDLAIRFLSQTRLSAKEISYRVGFSNVHNFRRAFKAWTGANPSRYQTLGG